MYCSNHHNLSGVMQLAHPFNAPNLLGTHEASIVYHTIQPRSKYIHTSLQSSSQYWRQLTRVIHLEYIQARRVSKKTARYSVSTTSLMVKGSVIDQIFIMHCTANLIILPCAATLQPSGSFPCRHNIHPSHDSVIVVACQHTQPNIPIPIPLFLAMFSRAMSPRNAASFRMIPWVVEST